MPAPGNSRLNNGQSKTAAADAVFVVFDLPWHTDQHGNSSAYGFLLGFFLGRIPALMLAFLPAVYGIRDFVTRGGLLAYSADFVAIFHRAARYVDQTLRGVRPGELPVQAPDKFTL